MNSKAGLSTLGLIIALALADPAMATVIQFGSEKDANMIQANPTFTAGGNPFVGTGRNQNGTTRRGLIQFDISSISTGATINSVSLTLYLRAWSGSGGMNPQPFGDPRNVVLHQVTSEWGNGTTVAGGGGGQGTASVMQGDVSWTNRSYSPTHPSPPTLTWATVGGGGDFEAASSASLLITNATTVNDPVTWTGAGLVADVQAWVNSTENNYGWILMIPNDQALPLSTLLEFYSKEETNTARRPLLTIDYTVAAAAVPEPASWTLATSVLMLLGWVGLRCRRRRMPVA